MIGFFCCCCRRLLQAECSFNRNLNGFSDWARYQAASDFDRNVHNCILSSWSSITLSSESLLCAEARWLSRNVSMPNCKRKSRRIIALRRAMASTLKSFFEYELHEMSIEKSTKTRHISLFDAHCSIFCCLLFKASTEKAFTDDNKWIIKRLLVRYMIYFVKRLCAIAMSS